MQYFDVVLAFAAFLCLCLFWNRRCRIPGALTPLLTCAVIMLWFTAAGLLGAMLIGGWVFYVVCAGLGIYAFVPVRKVKIGAPLAVEQRREPHGLFDFGFTAFFLLAVGIALLMAIRKPVFSEWDELSFWGTACKLVSLNDSLYTTAVVGWNWVGAQQPGAIMLSYFFQFFGSFAAWKSFVGYDVLLFACYAAVLGGVRWRDYPTGIPALLCCVLAPYLLTVYGNVDSVVGLYMSSYGDIPAGMAAGAALIWYWRAKEEQDGRLWGIFPILGAVAIIKENVFPIVLIAAGMMLCDMLLFEKRRLWKRIVYAVGFLAIPLAAYYAWNTHVGMVARLHESAGEVGATSLPLTAVLGMGLRQTFVPSARSETFQQVLQAMLHTFATDKLTLAVTLSGGVAGRLFGPENPLTRFAGTGAAVCLVIVVILLAAIFLCKEKRSRIRMSVAAGLSVVGFVAYHWVLLLSYTFIFKEGQAAGLTDYSRYTGSYYVFWLLLALALLVKSAQISRPAHAGTGALLVCAVLALVAVWRVVPVQMTVLDYPETTFAAQEEYADTATALQKQIQQYGDGKVFLVSTADNGIRYFNYCYAMLPCQMDYSFGGGPLGAADLSDEIDYYHQLTREELLDYLVENDCTYIFIDEFNARFRNDYYTIFTDMMSGVGAGESALYRQVTVDGQILYAPCLAEDANGGDDNV